MPETPKPTRYYEQFDFPGFMAEVGEEERLAAETIFHDDWEQDHKLRVDRLLALVHQVNGQLLEKGFIDTTAILGSGRIMPSERPAMLNDERHDSSMLDRIFDSDPGLVDGLYKGIGIFKEEFAQPNAGLQLHRPRLVHRVLLLHNEVADLGVEQVTKVYAHLPVDNPNIELFMPIFSVPPTENALSAMLRTGIDNSVSANLASFQIAFQRLHSANFKKVPLERNLDWLLDRFDAISGMVDHRLSVTAAGCVFQTNAQSMYRTARHTIEGTFVGFCSMPTYKDLASSDGSATAIEDEAEPQLGMCIEVLRNGQKALVKVPIRNIVEKQPEA